MENDEALVRWYQAASPYATPEALREALTSHRELIKACEEAREFLVIGGSDELRARLETRLRGAILKAKGIW